MKAYADYAYYTANFCGDMAEDDFNRHILTASQYIRYLTMSAADGYEGDELKMAACSAAELYLSASVSGVHGAVKSENNDGYSVTFVTEGKDGETREELIGRKVYAEVRKWLLPTGLLSRKAGCGHDYKCNHHCL